MTVGNAGEDGPTADGELPDAVARVLAEAEAPETGLYGPESVSWRVNRERSVQLGSISAMVTQWAHPALAQSGVDYYPDTGPPFYVSMALYDFLSTVTFGTVEEVKEAVHHLREVHDQVNGTYDHHLDNYEAGDRYTANAPDDLLFVHSVMIDHVLRAYEAFVGDLTDSERERYYQESQYLGRLLGVPAGRYPTSLDGMYDYYERVIDEELAVGQYAKQLQSTMFEAAGPTRLLQRFLTAGLLPRAVRTNFGFRWSSTHGWLFDRFAAGVRTALPVLPARVRYVDEYQERRS